MALFYACGGGCGYSALLLLMGYWIGRGLPGLPVEVRWRGFRPIGTRPEFEDGIEYSEVERDVIKN